MKCMALEETLALSLLPQCSPLLTEQCHMPQRHRFSTSGCSQLVNLDPHLVVNVGKDSWGNADLVSVSDITSLRKSVIGVGARSSCEVMFTLAAARSSISPFCL